MRETFSTNVAEIIFCTLAVRKMKIWIYWSAEAANQILEFILYYIKMYLNKNRKIYWSEQSFTGLGP
jgi:hypothetical protein